MIVHVVINDKYLGIYEKLYFRTFFCVAGCCLNSAARILIKKKDFFILYNYQ